MNLLSWFISAGTHAMSVEAAMLNVRLSPFAVQAAEYELHEVLPATRRSA